ncbi:uncharacterized protein LOC135709328 [Ochlerotatus camptorhynchus]|uniref:uncharacterized protein LOC135709328 n=1 Tax=Ochlerotatus camptorhynchus TaxID=644619 RepID=UPI0031E3C878
MLIIMTGIHHLITALNFKHSLDRDDAQPPIEKSIFDIISIYLDQGIFPNSISSSYRVLISFILLSGVVLSNSYASGLASVLTVPRYGKPIETIHDFVQTPYRWGAPAIAWVLSLFGADARDIQMVVEKFDIDEDDHLYRRALAGDYGLGVELLNGGSYAFGSYIREDNVRSFDILKEEFYFTYTIGYSQRGWPLMEYFNKFNLEAIQFGFVIQWEKRTMRKYLSHRVQEALQQISSGNNEGEELAPLTTQHIVGSMIILGIGLSAALVVFVLELILFALISRYERLHGKSSNTKVTRNTKSAFLMAKWLFGEAGNMQLKPPEAGGGCFNDSAWEIPSPVPVGSTIDDRSQLEDEELLDINPAELVECWYSDDEQEEEETDTIGAGGGGKMTCSHNLQGHRFKKLHHKKTKGIKGQILKAISTIG